MNGVDVLAFQIGISLYEISKYLPKDIIESLPTKDDINLHIDIEDNHI